MFIIVESLPMTSGDKSDSIAITSFSSCEGKRSQLQGQPNRLSNLRCGCKQHARNSANLRFPKRIQGAATRNSQGRVESKADCPRQMLREQKRKRSGIREWCSETP